MKLTLVQTKSAQMATKPYKRTELDDLKENSDFLLIYCGKKNTIVWKNGSEECVSDAELNELQKSYTWNTDF